MSLVKIGVLTSSRADYGIYKPLLTLMSRDQEVDLHLIVFGMHLQDKYGLTYQEVEKDAFGSIHRIGGMSEKDDAHSITDAYGKLIQEFGEFWSINRFNWVICLGDRFEMSAAVQSTIAFEIPLAHLHGGESTIGALDNIYRHQISLAAKLHFVAAEEFKERLKALMNQEEHIHTVGALSIADINDNTGKDWKTVASQFSIPEKSFILITVHPETVGAKKNHNLLIELIKALEELAKRWLLVITMPNADIYGDIYRNAFIKLKKDNKDSVTLVENFGKENYFSAMKASAFLLGNTSSGILEAASFGKYVINLGDRQKGRLQSNNIINVGFDSEEILNSVSVVNRKGAFTGNNKYYRDDTAVSILNIIKGTRV